MHIGSMPKCAWLRTRVLAQIYATCIKQPSLHIYFFGSSVCMSVSN